MGNASLNPPFFSGSGPIFRILAYYITTTAAAATAVPAAVWKGKKKVSTSTTTTTTTTTIAHHANPRKPRHPRRKHNLFHPLLDLRQPPRLRPSIHATSLRRRRLDHGIRAITLHSLSHRPTRRNRTRHRTTFDRFNARRRDAGVEILVFL